MPTPQRLAVLFAAPLARRDESGNLLPVDLLDFEAERQLLLDTFNEAGRLVEIRIEAATADLFQTLLTLGCRAVHYSGHGNRDFLAFENGQGEAHLLDANQLKQLLASAGPPGRAWYLLARAIRGKGVKLL